MIIATPPFEPSRMVRNFKKAYREQKTMSEQEAGFSEKIQMAAKAAGVTIGTEIGLMMMV